MYAVIPVTYLILTIYSIQVNPRNYKLEVITYCLRDRFAQNHPKFVKFMGDLASSQIEEGTILEVTVKKPDGRTMVSNIKVTASDLEMLQAIKQM